MLIEYIEGLDGTTHVEMLCVVWWVILEDGVRSVMMESWGTCECSQSESAMLRILQEPRSSASVNSCKKYNPTVFRTFRAFIKMARDNQGVAMPPPQSLDQPENLRNALERERDDCIPCRVMGKQSGCGIPSLAELI